MIPLKDIHNKTILISPLDWGWGHTTRCVSIINELMKEGNKIIFAGNLAQIKFILLEFPELQTTFINGYNISLSSNKSTYFQIAKQGKKYPRLSQMKIFGLKNFSKIMWLM